MTELERAVETTFDELEFYLAQSRLHVCPFILNYLNLMNYMLDICNSGKTGQIEEIKLMYPMMQDRFKKMCGQLEAYSPNKLIFPEGSLKRQYLEMTDYMSSQSHKLKTFLEKPSRKNQKKEKKSKKLKYKG